MANDCSCKLFSLIFIEVAFISLLLTELIYLIVYVALPSFINNGLIAYANNKYAEPIYDISLESEYLPILPLYTDKGYEGYCKCDEGITIGKCEKDKKYYCDSTSGIPENVLPKWRNNAIRVNRRISDPVNYNSYISHFIYCDDYSHSCGKITADSWLCINSERVDDDECPINRVIMTDSEEPPDDKFKYKHVKFSDYKYLHYTNQDRNGTILVSLNVTEGKMCVNAVMQNSEKNNYFLYKGRNERCDGQYDGNYQYLDSIIQYDFYNDNNYLYILRDLPDYDISSLKQRNFTLYARGYLVNGIKKDYDFPTYDSFINMNHHNNVITIIRLCILIIVFIACIMHPFLMKNKYKTFKTYFKDKTLIFNCQQVIRLISHIVLIILNAYLYNYTALCYDSLTYSFIPYYYPDIKTIKNSIQRSNEINFSLFMIGFINLTPSILFILMNCLNCGCDLDKNYNEVLFNKKGVEDAPAPIAPPE